MNIHLSAQAMLKEVGASLEARAELEATKIHAVQIDVLAMYYVSRGYGSEASFDFALNNINKILGE